MRDGSKRRAASRGVSAGCCPSALRAKAKAARTRASSSASSGQRAVPLAELLPVGSDDERQVRVRRRRQPERALERDLPRRRVEEVRAAHDLRDALRRVVDDDRELVGVRPVRAVHDEVADGGFEVFGK